MFSDMDMIDGFLFNALKHKMSEDSVISAYRSRLRVYHKQSSIFRMTERQLMTYLEIHYPDFVELVNKYYQ